jgi:3-oxoacyl-[acyl-carrier protein] reductase
MFDLSGKTALVTGASGGLGSAIVKALAGQGARVAVSGSNEAKLANFASGFGEQAVPLVCNLSNAEEVDQLVPRALEALGGRLDIIVNNAGITRDNLAMRMKDEEFQEVIRINLEAAFRIMRAALKPMMKSRGGRIINITSVIGLIGNAGQANYAAAKAGIIGFTKATAREMASRNITVNAVAPGYVETELTSVLGQQVREAILEAIPLGRIGTPQDVANIVCFLASDAAAYITGQTLAVDGGMVMH